jgi:hypothetical protein
MMDREAQLTALADSPSVDHQEIMNNNTEWKQIDVPLQERTIIPDGRQIYYETAERIEECTGKDNGTLDKLPDISSVSYFSDGNTLDTTFWLSKAPLVNHAWQNLSRSNISQVFLLIEHFPENEAKNITESYPNLTITSGTNDTKITTLGNQRAHQISFNGTVNDIFGNRTVTGFSLSAVKDNELYRISYFAFADQKDIVKFKPDVEKMIRSFKILSSTDVSTKGKMTQEQPLRLYDNTNKGMEINYTSNWNFNQFSQNRVLFFSPIGFYFMGTSYQVLIDVPSSYDVPTDFVAKLVWWHRFPERNWAKFIEEASSPGPTRTLDEKRNFTEFFKKKGDWEAYAFMPIRLRTINSPNESLMLFLTGATYVLNGRLCEVVQSTDTVSSPPPRLSILPLTNISSFGPSEEKQIEVRVNSFSDIPYTVVFENQTKGVVSATFDPPSIQVPASGFSTTQLNLKRIPYSTWIDFTWTGFKRASSWTTETQTIPIAAETTISSPQENRTFSFENKTVSANFSNRFANSMIEGSSVTVTALNWPDYLMNSISILSSPVSVLVPVAGVIGGIITWFLKREKEKREEKRR